MARLLANKRDDEDYLQDDRLFILERASLETNEKMNQPLPKKEIEPLAHEQWANSIREELREAAKEKFMKYM